jgi:hypothetical protein
LKEDVRIYSVKDDDFGVGLGTDFEVDLTIYLGSENCKHMPYRLKIMPDRLKNCPID